MDINICRFESDWLKSLKRSDLIHTVSIFSLLRSSVSLFASNSKNSTKFCFFFVSVQKISVYRERRKIKSIRWGWNWMHFFQTCSLYFYVIETKINDEKKPFVVTYFWEHDLCRIAPQSSVWGRLKSNTNFHQYSVVDWIILWIINAKRIHFKRFQQRLFGFELFSIWISVIWAVFLFWGKNGTPQN